MPAAAWWSTKSGMWVLGEKDADGELHGEVRHYRVDGSLCAVTALVHGKHHGPFRRVHETGETAQTGTYRDGKLDGLRVFMAATGPTTEPMYAGGLSRDVVRIEYDYVMGRLLATRYRDAEGRALNQDGTLAPARPAGVPQDALYSPKTETWMLGEWDADGRRDGVMRVYDTDGALVATETYAANVAAGLTTTFHPDGSPWTTTTFAHGRVNGIAEQFHPNGQRARRTRLCNDTYAGALEDWDADGVSLGSTTWPAPLERAPVQLPDHDEADDRVRALIDCDHPNRLLALIALGWGGSADRDRHAARRARRYVRSLPALAAALASVGLDTGPRLHTARRARQLIEALRSVPGISADALAFVLALHSWPARALNVQDSGGWGLRAVRRAVTDDLCRLTFQGLDHWPPTLSCLPTLRAIDLSHNQLTLLPDSVHAQFNLRVLRLTENRLERLPAMLGRLRCLTELSVGHNRLTDVDAITRLLMLRRLDLGRNRLTTLPDDVGRLGQLRDLWLNDNPLRTLPRSFANLANLRFLHLADSPWRSPPPVIFELTALEELWLGSRHLQELPEDIGNLRGLRKLIIWYSDLRTLPRAIFNMTGLEELRIRDNPLPPGTLERLKEALPDCTIY